MPLACRAALQIGVASGQVSSPRRCICFLPGEVFATAGSFGLNASFSSTCCSKRVSMGGDIISFRVLLVTPSAPLRALLRQGTGLASVPAEVSEAAGGAAGEAPIARGCD